MVRAKEPALRLELRGGAIETNNRFEVASIYINRLNAKLAESGFGSNNVRYKSHHESGDRCFVLCGTVPASLSDWVDKLPICSALIFQGEEVEFRLNIPINERTREVSSETHQSVKGVIESLKQSSS